LPTQRSSAKDIAVCAEFTLSYTWLKIDMNCLTEFAKNIFTYLLTYLLKK